MPIPASWLKCMHMEESSVEVYLFAACVYLFDCELCLAVSLVK